MARKIRSSLFSLLIAPVLILGVLLSSCDTAASDSSSENTETTALTETSTSTTETTVPTTEETTSATTSKDTEETSADESESSEPDENSSEETTEEIRDIGYGPYGFLNGELTFHSQNDISMMIQQEDATVYDFGARKSDWIDAYYIEDSFDMKPFDASYRFLGFYNNETSVSFRGAVDIGPWTTPKGSNLELYITDITIVSRNLVIKILPKDPQKPEKYNVSICGRGYYASTEQLQMMDFFLSYLDEHPGVDPLEGLIEAEDHTYYY